MSPNSATDQRTEVLKFWRHVFGGERGLLWVWTGVRGEDGKIPQKTIKESSFDYPSAATAAAEWAFEKTEEGREVYFCCHLLQKPRRIKENAARVAALWG